MCIFVTELVIQLLVKTIILLLSFLFKKTHTQTSYSQDC